MGNIHKRVADKVSPCYHKIQVGGQQPRDLPNVTTSAGKVEGSNSAAGRLRARRMLSTGAERACTSPSRRAPACAVQGPNEAPQQSLEVVRSRSQSRTCG